MPRQPGIQPRHPGITCQGIQALHAKASRHTAQASRHYMPRHPGITCPGIPKRLARGHALHGQRALRGGGGVDSVSRFSGRGPSLAGGGLRRRAACGRRSAACRWCAGGRGPAAAACGRSSAACGRAGAGGVQARSGGGGRRAGELER